MHAELTMELLRSRPELEAAQARAVDRRAYEELLQTGYAAVPQFHLPAICQACGTAQGLLADRHHGYEGRVNFRERLECPRCRLNTRQRFMAHLVRTALAEGGRAEPQVYLHEQVTPFYGWARTALPGTVIGSEYLGHDVPGGAVIDGIRHEDALALSFADASVDVIVSQEVLEHVPAIEPAIAEAARVLRPGGRLFLSVPFHAHADATVQRATLRDGEVVHLLEPQFHGNPVSAEGSLVFYDHGWDLLDRLRDHGFADAYVLGYWSALYGYLGGDGLLTMISAVRG
jgi:SAM-dependent methyltransferase